MGRSISVVIPVYNSGETLVELTDRLVPVLESLCDPYEIILIDDGSVDNSFTVMLELNRRNRNIKSIQLDGNFGQQNAILCGLGCASGDYVVTMDDDLQHPPEELGKLIDEIEEGYDMVYGIPARKMHSIYRNIGTVMMDYLFTLVLGKPRNIKISSFRAIRNDLSQKILRYNTPFVYISAMAFKLKVRVANVVVNHDSRKYGFSNYRLIKLLKLYMGILVNYSFLSNKDEENSQVPKYMVRSAHL